MSTKAREAKKKLWRAGRSVVPPPDGSDLVLQMLRELYQPTLTEFSLSLQHPRDVDSPQTLPQLFNGRNSISGEEPKDETLRATNMPQVDRSRLEVRPRHQESASVMAA